MKDAFGIDRAEVNKAYNPLSIRGIRNNSKRIISLQRIGSHHEQNAAHLTQEGAHAAAWDSSRKASGFNLAALQSRDDVIQGAKALRRNSLIAGAAGGSAATGGAAAFGVHQKRKKISKSDKKKSVATGAAIGGAAGAGAGAFWGGTYDAARNPDKRTPDVPWKGNETNRSNMMNLMGSEYVAAEEAKAGKPIPKRTRPQGMPFKEARSVLGTKDASKLKLKSVGIRTVHGVRSHKGGLKGAAIGGALGAGYGAMVANDSVKKRDSKLSERIAKGLGHELFVGEKYKYGKDNPVGYVPGKGGRLAAGKVSARESAFFSPKGTNRKKNWGQLGANVGGGLAAGGAIGAGTGALLGGKAGAVRGALAGAAVGELAGYTNANRMRSNRSLNRAFDNAVKTGTMRKPNADEKVNWKGSIAPKKKS